MVKAWTPRPPVEALAATSRTVPASGAEPAARRTTEWSVALLSRAAAHARALYGTVTVEETMPGPAAVGLLVGTSVTAFLTGPV
jgi:hypothetical protein